jgi:hypothetical protein
MLAGCGGSTRVTHHAASQPRPECTGSKDAAKRAHARTRLNADLARLRVAAKKEHGYSQQGSDQLNAALTPFLLHVAQETLPVKERSRFIDKAAAIVSPYCYLCFQALESSRPTGATAKLTCD